MIDAALITAAATNFLAATDTAYAECTDGIAELEKIVVGVPAARADTTRGYLLPIVYAYWERFFKNLFAEYLRGYASLSIPFGMCDAKVAGYRIRREMLAFERARNAAQFSNLIDKYTVAELSKALRQWSEWLTGAVTFRDPSNWVNTESNVQFNVVESNCKRFGVSVDNIKNGMSPGRSLYVGLKELVDERNVIAHGEQFQPVSAAKWRSHVDFVLELFHVLQFELHSTLTDQTRLIQFNSSPLNPSGKSVGEYADDDLAP